MKQKLVHLTDEMVDYLEKIKEEHNISSSAYLRLLLRDDMSGRQTTVGVTFDAVGRSVVRNPSTLNKERTAKIQKHKTKESKVQIDMIKELKSVLEERRKLCEQYEIVTKDTYETISEENIDIISTITNT